MRITGFTSSKYFYRRNHSFSDFRPFKVARLFDILESEETSGQNGEAQGKKSTGTEGAETKGGACGTTADEIPGTWTKV